MTWYHWYLISYIQYKGNGNLPFIYQLTTINLHLCGISTCHVWLPEGEPPCRNHNHPMTIPLDSLKISHSATCFMGYMLNPRWNHHVWSVNHGETTNSYPIHTFDASFGCFLHPFNGNTPSLSGQLPAEEVRHFAPGARCIAKAILSSGQKGWKTAPSCRGCRVWCDHFLWFWCDFVRPTTTIFGLLLESHTESHTATHPQNPSGWWCCVHVFGLRGREKRC